MTPLAVSGLPVIAVTVSGAVLLLIALLRGDAREHPDERDDGDQRTVTTQRSE
jgi:hypothetical protein